MDLTLIKSKECRKVLRWICGVPVNKVNAVRCWCLYAKWFFFSLSLISQLSWFCTALFCFHIFILLHMLGSQVSYFLILESSIHSHPIHYIFLHSYIYAHLCGQCMHTCVHSSVRPSPLFAIFLPKKFAGFSMHAIQNLWIFYWIIVGLCKLQFHDEQKEFGEK